MLSVNAQAASGSGPCSGRSATCWQLTNDSHHHKAAQQPPICNLASIYITTSYHGPTRAIHGSRIFACEMQIVPGRHMS